MCILLSPVEIAERILERCKAQHIGARSLCKSQHIGENTIYNIKIKNSYPQIDTMAKIAAGLGCTVDALIYRSTEPETEHRYSVQQHHDE